MWILRKDSNALKTSVRVYDNIYDSLLQSIKIIWKVHFFLNTKDHILTLINILGSCSIMQTFMCQQ